MKAMEKQLLGGKKFTFTNEENTLEAVLSFSEKLGKFIIWYNGAIVASNKTFKATSSKLNQLCNDNDLKENVKIVLKKEKGIQPKENSHKFDKSNNNNNLKTKKMRNLIKLAVLFAVAPSETDVDQLGFEPTIEDFKNYFEIPAEATDATYKDSSNFDAYGDLAWMLTDEEKAILDPDRAENATETEPGVSSEAAPAVVADHTIPEAMAPKHKELKEEVELCEASLKEETKQLDKVTKEGQKGIDASQAKLDAATAKADPAKPETGAKVNQAKSNLNLSQKESIKNVKAQTAKVNKAQAQLDKANANMNKFLEKVAAANAKAKAKAEKDANKTPKTTKKEVTELTRSQQIYVYAFEGRTAKMIAELHPDWAPSHIRNSIQTSRTEPERLKKALELQATLKLPVSVKDSHKPAPVVKEEKPKSDAAASATEAAAAEATPAAEATGEAAETPAAE